MAKTKEETIEITTKNYFAVQKQAIDSVETLEKHHNVFNKEAKASLSEYKATLKDIANEEKEAAKDHANQNKDINTRHQDHHKQITINKNDAKKQLDKELASHEKEFGKGTGDLDKAIVKINEAHAKQLETLDAGLVSDTEKSNKNITEIEEKGVKDEATFTQKLGELEEKYNAKITSLNEKETVKIQKLEESTAQKTTSIEELIQKELDKHNKALATKQALYEEELEEIDEKVAYEKTQFETKYNSIKESAEKRLAVREKHLQRALNDNDKRSSKQHKKDIDKIKSETKTDLAVLEKNHNQQMQHSVDYRISFVKDYYHEVADLNEKFQTYKEEKTEAIEFEQAALEHDIAATKLEYDELRAKELSEYNEKFAQVTEKQETAKMQRNLAVEQEHHNQVLLQVNHQKATAIANKELEDALETKAKERRVLTLQLQKDIDVSNNTYQEAIIRLDAEGEIADMEQQRDLLVLSFNEEITAHTLQHKRNTGIKDEFATYQKHIGPLFLNRTRELKSYEDVEIENRKKLKMQFYEGMKKDLDKDYEVLKQKVEETAVEEAAFLETKIEEIAGPKTEALAEFVQEGEAKLRELRSEFETLTDSKDKKERKQKEQLYNKETRLFQDEKARKEAELNQQVGAYRTLLEDVKHRKDMALQDVKEAYDKSAQLLQDTMDKTNDHANQELEQAAHLVSATDDIFNQFNLQVASRTQQQSDAQTAYLNTQVERETLAIQNANAAFERNRDLTNEDMHNALAEMAQEKQDLLATYKSNVEQEEQLLEQFKNNIAAGIESIQATATSQTETQNATFTTLKNDLTSALNHAINQIKSTLQGQVDDYNQTLDTIQKGRHTEEQKHDAEQKRIKKEGAERLKEIIRQIKTDVQEQIKAL